MDAGARDDDDDPSINLPSAPAGSPPAAPRRLSRGARFARWACRAYLAAMLSAWAAIALGADRWWAASIAMYGPAWVYATPLIVLLPLAGLLHRRSLVVLLAAGLVVVFPLGRFCVPWRAALPDSTAAGSRLPLRRRVITGNADHTHLSAADLGRLVERARPDLVVLQGWRTRYEKTVFARDGWHVRREGDLCLASRFPIAASRLAGERIFSPEARGGAGMMAHYELAGPSGPIHVINVHLATPRDALEAMLNRAVRASAAAMADNTALRREQSRLARSWVDALSGPVIVAGDFNMPTVAGVYEGHWSGLINAFSHAGWGWGHTHYTPKTAVRIDHVLLTPGWSVSRAWVGEDVGSAHRPVIADVVWTGR